MTFSEQTFTFPCGEKAMLGMLAAPEKDGVTGVLVVVGGPQYRVGSHRQFLLLSRALATAGYPTMRFDYRGMGDSQGELRNFEAASEDIAAAIEAFFARCPQLNQVILWGLCDAASAILLYLDETNDARVAGLCLLNPWVRSEASLARTQIKHYYSQRLVRPEFWLKLFSGKLGIGKALAGFSRNLASSLQSGQRNVDGQPLGFQQKMERALSNFNGAVLLVLSGADYSAKEFLEYVGTSNAFSAALLRPCVTRIDIADADHTFSTAEWRGAVEIATASWLKKLK